MICFIRLYMNSILARLVFAYEGIDLLGMTSLCILSLSGVKAATFECRIVE